jgi:fucose permease
VLPASDNRQNESVPTVALNLGFALTGVGTTLFGCLLPTLISRWHLSDEHAGLIFAAQFTGSALGALLLGSNLFRGILCGYLLLIASAFLVPFPTGFARLSVFFAFGLGMGLAMTATSMFLGRAFAANRGATLSLLNASWSVGAAFSPVIAVSWVEHWPAQRLFSFFGTILAIIFICLLRERSRFNAAFPRDAFLMPLFPRAQFAILGLMGFLYVGTEVSVSGWMMSYVHRFPIAAAWAPAATSCFWVAVICGRALLPIALRFVSEAQALRYAILGGILSLICLLFSGRALAVAVSSTLAGLMLAPIFPLCISRALDVMRDSPNCKWIFAVSGIGGAVLPLITGTISAHRDSLRQGLAVPVFALASLMILEFVSARSYRLHEIA